MATKTMKKPDYPKGQPSGARGKPETRSKMTAPKVNKEKSMKGQPPKNPVKKGVPFKNVQGRSR
jgi:hypothetical protein